MTTRPCTLCDDACEHVCENTCPFCDGTKELDSKECFCAAWDSEDCHCGVD